MVCDFACYSKTYSYIVFPNECSVKCNWKRFPHKVLLYLYKSTMLIFHLWEISQSSLVLVQAYEEGFYD